MNISVYLRMYEICIHPMLLIVSFYDNFYIL